MTTTDRPAKRKVSVSLDAELVAELEAADETLSAQVNEAVRAAVEERRRRRQMRRYLDELEAAHGPPDERLVCEFMDLLR